jgi:hypothetical protein
MELRPHFLFSLGNAGIQALRRFPYHELGLDQNLPAPPGLLGADLFKQKISRPLAYLNGSLVHRG